MRDSCSWRCAVRVWSVVGLLVLVVWVWVWEKPVVVAEVGALGGVAEGGVG